MAAQGPKSERPFWMARATQIIFFFAAALTIAGCWAATRVPISVFPETNFPRVVIGVDNGVMPVEQMEVTITKPIESAVNSVPGLVTVRSNTSRGSAEVSLFFDWSVDMFKTLQLVNAALATVQQSLPPIVKITTRAMRMRKMALRPASPAKLKPERRPPRAEVVEAMIWLTREMLRQRAFRGWRAARAGPPALDGVRPRCRARA